jgi:hypothetical protein
MLFHGNNGFANAPRSYVYMYIVCLVIVWHSNSTRTQAASLVMFLDRTQLGTHQADCSEQVIRPSQRLLPTRYDKYN